MPATSTRRRVALIACDRHRRIRLVASDAVVEAAAGAAATDRTLRGLALPYAADGRTSAGRVRASAGVVRWPADLRRVKVFTGHDRTRPVGYVTTLTETNDGLVAELHIAGTPDGDAALLEAREGTRDAMSVELEDVELDDDGELLAAELVAIALVPLPAFSDARIAAERDDDDDQDDQPPASAPPGAGGGRGAGRPAAPGAAGGRRPARRGRRPRSRPAGGGRRPSPWTRRPRSSPRSTSTAAAPRRR
jgi:HK97 family phage prohead protease